MTGSSRERAFVFLETAGVAAGYVISVWAVYTRLVIGYIASPLLSLATAFVLVQSSAIALLVTTLIGRKCVSGIRERRGRRMYPPILDALATHAAGIDRSADLRRWRRRRPAYVERCLADILPTILGLSRDRLSQLAVDLGVVTRWERQYRSRRVGTRRTAIALLGQLSGGQGVPALLAAIDDPDLEIRLDAARNILRSGRRRSDVETVFAFAIRASLLARAILADELRSHALILSERAIPDRLRSGDRDEIVVVLEMIHAWGRALPLPDVVRLLHHVDREVRVRALRALPCVAGAGNLEGEIVDRLRDEEPRVRGAAAFAAGRLGVASADALLAGCLRDPYAEVALAAGFALAELGQIGVGVLEREIVSPCRPAAVAALEALERLKIGRCDYARR